MKSLNKLTTIVSSCLLSFSVSAGELYAPRTIFDHTDTNLVAKLRFAQPETGDMYLATMIETQLLFITPTGLNATPAPLLRNTTFEGEYDILSVNTNDLTAGIYPLYQLITIPEGNPLNVMDWIGGFDSLHTINFMIGMPPEVSGDGDGDGFADDDVNHDGYRDNHFNHDNVGNNEQPVNNPPVENSNDYEGEGEEGDEEANDDGENAELPNNPMPNVPNNINDTTPVVPTPDPVVPAPVPVATVNYDGKTLYSDNCTRCHGGGYSVKGTTSARIQLKIDRNSGGMGILRGVLNGEEVAAIAAYLQTL